MSVDPARAAALGEEIVERLSALGSPIRRHLRPGLSDIELAGKTRPLGISLPPAVEALYRWHDGVRLSSEVPLTEVWLFPGYFQVPLGDFSAHLRAQPPWQPGWMPMFNDDAGYYYLVDCGSGAILRFDNDDPEAYPVYRGLTPMLETVLACYREGVYRWDPDVGLIGDVEGEWAVARRLNPDIPYWAR